VFKTERKKSMFQGSEPISPVAGVDLPPVVKDKSKMKDVDNGVQSPVKGRE
jgi:hypothetical protein